MMKACLTIVMVGSLVGHISNGLWPMWRRPAWTTIPVCPTPAVLPTYGANCPCLVWRSVQPMGRVGLQRPRKWLKATPPVRTSVPPHPPSEPHSVLAARSMDPTARRHQAGPLTRPALPRGHPFCMQIVICMRPPNASTRPASPASTWGTGAHHPPAYGQAVDPAGNASGDPSPRGGDSKS